MDQKMVKSPAHYTEGRKFEPKDVIRDWGLGFNLGSTVKYIARAGRKDDILQELYKAKEFLQFEIEAIEAEREKAVKPATPKHPNCRCIPNPPYCKGSGISFEDAIKYSKEMVRDSFRIMMDELMQDEICSVKPIILEVPKDRNIKEFLKEVTDGLKIFIEEPKKEDPTEFQKRAMSLYNAYLYKLDKIRKELKDKKDAGLLDVGCVFSPTVVVKEGFDPEEVLEGLTKKIMEGR